MKENGQNDERLVLETAMEAGHILLENGGLDIPDIREGENSTSELYIFIQMEKAKLAGQTITPAQVAVPFVLDLRMSGV